MHRTGFFSGLTVLKTVVRPIFIAICSISLTSCMVYVSSEEPEVVAAKITAGSSDHKICEEAAILQGKDRLVWRQKKRIWVKEAQKRGLDCNKILAQKLNFSTKSVFSKPRGPGPERIASSTDGFVCASATKPSSSLGDKKIWNSNYPDWVDEAKRRGLICGVAWAAGTQITSSSTTQAKTPTSAGLTATERETDPLSQNIKAPKARQEQLSVHFGNRTQLSNLPDCMQWEMGLKATLKQGIASLYPVRNCFGTLSISGVGKYIGEFQQGQYHGYGIYTSFVTGEVKKGIWENNKLTRAREWPPGEVITNQIASLNGTDSNTTAMAELTVAQKDAERSRQEIAAIELQQKAASTAPKQPTITILNATTNGAQGNIRGHLNDNTGVAEFRIDGQKIAVDSNGNFSATTYVPEGGTSVNIEAINLAGLSSTITVRMNRATTQTAVISFEKLNPLKRKGLPNKDAIALIIGIAEYKNTENSAYADKDALVFRDYAIEKLGIPDNQITTLINEDAEIGEVLLSIRKWVRRSTKPDKTDVYVFFAGHGLATATGEAYLLPYDGRPEVDLLDRTALLQTELFAEIEKAKPRNATIFLDACYTGKARTGEVLLGEANYRPIAIRAVDDGMPDNFTLITASSGDEFSGPLEEAKHGIFSYFLMKGMEGEADTNNDNQITAGELHSYVQTHVIQQSSGLQTPELQGDANRVLVRFQ